MNAQTKIQASGVYAKIAAVQGELSKVGISKDRRNSQQGYQFRGIDDVYAALSPLLAAHGLVIIPRMKSRDVVERQTAKGGALFNVTVLAEFDFVSADDGSIHTASTYGEAMDSADKATNKAMSAAYKYAAFMTFAIPTDGDNDADAHTPEVSGKGAPNPKPDAITHDQLVKLEMLIKATSSNEILFLRAMGAPDGARICELPQSLFADAEDKLNKKLAKMAKEETDAKAKVSPAATNQASGAFGDILADEIPF